MLGWLLVGLGLRQVSDTEASLRHVSLVRHARLRQGSCPLLGCSRTALLQTGLAGGHAFRDQKAAHLQQKWARGADADARKISSPPDRILGPADMGEGKFWAGLGLVCEASLRQVRQAAGGYALRDYFFGVLGAFAGRMELDLSAKIQPVPSFCSKLWVSQVSSGGGSEIASFRPKKRRHQIRCWVSCRPWRAT